MLLSCLSQNSRYNFVCSPQIRDVACLPACRSPGISLCVDPGTQSASVGGLLDIVPAHCAQCASINSPSRLWSRLAGASWRRLWWGGCGARACTHTRPNIQDSKRACLKDRGVTAACGSWSATFSPHPACYINSMRFMACAKVAPVTCCSAPQEPRFATPAPLLDCPSRVSCQQLQCYCYAFRPASVLELGKVRTPNSMLQ